MPSLLWQRHLWRNRFQTILLALVLFSIACLAGYLILGEDGFLIALLASSLALLIEPAAGYRLTLRLYGARPIEFQAAPQLWHIVNDLASRAGLPSQPVLHYTPSAVINAFAVGSANHAAIALSEGLLRTLSLREIAAVLAHEVAHIAHGDLRVMNLADYISRLTALFAMVGQLMLLLYLPWLLSGSMQINWEGLLLLAISPYLALSAQMGLSRIREFDADLEAARLCGDPAALASALAQIERVNQSWRQWLLPGWGNPDPSWLRSHPPTKERIARLQELLRADIEHSAWNSDWQWPARNRNGAFAQAKPHWHIGGHWW